MFTDICMSVNVVVDGWCGWANLSGRRRSLAVTWVIGNKKTPPTDNTRVPDSSRDVKDDKRKALGIILSTTKHFVLHFFGHQVRGYPHSSLRKKTYLKIRQCDMPTWTFSRYTDLSFPYVYDAQYAVICKKTHVRNLALAFTSVPQNNA